MDADLQDPPELLPSMLDILRRSNFNNSELSSYDVVQGFRLEREIDSFFKRKSASFYYKLIKKITGVEVIPNAADFRVISRAALDILLNLPEENKIYRLLIPKIGMNVYPFPFPRGERFAGSTKYSLKKMISLGVDSIITFSFLPLRFLAIGGTFISLTLFFLALATFFLWIFQATIPGWTSLVLLILSLNSLIFAAIGLLGEYVGRIYEIAQKRPAVIWTEYLRK